MAIKASSRKKTSTKTSSPSKQIGLNQKQVSQLRGMKGIDQKALSAYEASGSVVGGRNNPRGRGRENVPVITPERVAPTEVADIPTMKAPTTDFSSILSMGNAGLVDPQTGLTQQNGQFVYDPSKSAAVNAAEEANLGNLNALKASAQLLKPQENELSNVYAQMERRAGIQGLQKEVGAYSSQLNAITSSRDAEILKLEGQGRGQTQGFIGGEQARINREAAIQALPVQAQLAAAQGNLEMAQSRVNTLFQIKAQDIAAQNAYKTNLANSVMQYANAAQQNILNAKLSDIQKQEQREQQAIADAKNIAMQAIEYGQSSLASRVMELDPKSPTYQQDVNAALGQLRKPVAAGKRDTQVVNGQLIDMQTGEIISTVGATSGGTLTGKPQTQSQARVMGYADRLREAEKTLITSNKFASLLSIGGILPNALKTEARQEYDQAKRNFVNAVLRTESGAVISDEEFANAEKQYFPSYGDSAGVIAQKAANRNTVINNFYREANMPRPVSVGDIIESDGIRYKVDADGVTLIEL